MTNSLYIIYILSVLVLAIGHIVLVSGGIAEQIHKGIDKAIEGVVNGAIEVTGTPVDAKDITFLLKTAKDKDQIGDAKSFDIKKIADTKEKIFFFIHGWTQNRTSCPWFEPMTKLLLEKYPESHIVQVDWGKPAEQNYAYAAFSTQSVGEIIAIAVQKLVKEYNFPLQKIIFIGHSLGGQILGWIGKEYRKLTNQSLPRLIALDPAGPIFDVRPDTRRLNKNDAEVVMVVHTDRLKFGFPSSCGTVDFFPNDGLNQPGCAQLNLTDLSLSALTDPIWCSHRRAHDLFVQAIKQPEGFISTKCDSYKNYENRKCDGNVEVSMGDWQTSETGSFYLETTGETPFIKGQKLQKKGSKSSG